MAEGLWIINVTIANGASLSSALETSGLVPVAIIMPAAWTAAGLRWQACTTTAGTYQSIKDRAGNFVDLTVAAADIISMEATSTQAKMIALPFMKLLSHTAGTPVNQGAARIIQVILAPRT